MLVTLVIHILDELSFQKAYSDMWRSHENQEIKLEVVQQTDNYREWEEQSG